MQTLGLTLTLFATFAIGVYELYRKHILNRKLFTEYELRVGLCAVISVTCALFLVSAGEWWDTLAPQKENLTLWLIGLAITTAANGVFQFAAMRSARLLDASFRAPVMLLTPGLVVLAGLLIGEWPSTWGLGGIVLIGFGAYVHVREDAQWRDYFVPLWFGFRRLEGVSAKEREKIIGLRWAYLGAISGTIGLLGDGLLARHGDMVRGMTLEFGALALLFAPFPRHTKGEEVIGPLTERFRAHWRKIVALGLMFAFFTILLGVGFRVAPVAYIGSLKRLAVVITVIGGVWFLREKAGARRILLTCVVVIGSILIAFDPTPAVVLDSLDDYLKHLVGG